MTAENRMAQIAALLGASAAAALLFARGPRPAAALAAGVALSLGNYWWLKAGAHALLPDSGAPHPAGAAQRGALKFFARFILLGACVYAIIMSHLLPMDGLVCGLFAVPAAALLVGISELLTTGFKSERS